MPKSPTKPTSASKTPQQAAKETLFEAVRMLDGIRKTATPQDPWKPRLCRLCKATFKPTGKNSSNARKAQFCCENHRKEFWKHGGLPFNKLMMRIEGEVRKIAREEARSILAAVMPPAALMKAMESAPPILEAPRKAILTVPPTRTARTSADPETLH